MDTDMKFYIPTNFSGETGTGDAMRNALVSIAQEIQRFRLESEIGTKHKNGHGVKILVQKDSDSRLDSKNKQMNKLKDHLKAVYSVAKIVLLSKNRETDLLMNHLNEIRNESSNLSKMNAENLSLIQELRLENYKIYNDVEFLNHFIHMAYKKIQTMRDEQPKDISFIEELQTILVACRQYHADYCNSRERCAQLERRNRFLKNKLNIVENNLIATTEELRNLRSLNTKLRIKSEMNCKRREPHSKNLTHANVSDITLDIGLGDGTNTDGYNTPPLNSNSSKHNLMMPNICMTHLETVRNLLIEQENMLKELKDLHLDIISPESEENIV